MLPSLHQLSLRPARGDEDEEEPTGVLPMDKILAGTLWRQLPPEIITEIEKAYQGPNDPCRRSAQRVCTHPVYSMNHEMKNWCDKYFKQHCSFPPVVAVPNAQFPVLAPIAPFLCGPHGVYNPYDSGHQRQWRRQFAMFCNVVYGQWGNGMATRRAVFEALKSLSDTMIRFPPLNNLVNPNNGIQQNVFSHVPHLDIDWLPPSVVHIGVSAFEGCSGLRRLRLPEGLLMIDDQAFLNCRTLEELDLPNTVHTIGSLAFFNCRRLRRLRLPERELGERLQTIPSGMCLNCPQLERIDLPNNIVAISSDAFHNCVSLRAIGWSSSLATIERSAFRQCTSLAGKVVLPGSLTAFEEGAFQDCTAMTAIDQAREAGRESIYLIPVRVCSGCTSLVEAPILLNVTTISAEAFKNCVSLSSTKQNPLPFSSGLHRIRTEAFAGCTSLQYVHVPDSVVEIQFSSFEGCTNLAEVRLPDNRRYPQGYNFLQNFTFKNSGLRTIHLPSNLRFVGREAFAGCKQLQTITVAPHQEIPYVHDPYYPRYREVDLNLANSAFERCEKLIAFMTPKTHLVSIKMEAFKDCTSLDRVAFKLCSDLGARAFKGCTNLKTVTFYPKVGPEENAQNLRFLSIGEQCFQDCEHLAAIEIPDSVGFIGQDAFRACRQLKTVTLPPRIAEVAVTCFKDCSALEEIEIPYQVRIIQSGAFDLCRSLRKVTFGRGPNNEPPRLDLIAAFAFGGCNNIEEFVLPASVTRVSNFAFPSNFVERGRVTEAARPEGSRRIYYYDRLDDD